MTVNQPICHGAIFFQIWSCDHCYSFFHLNCLQKWAKDSLSQQKIHQDDETVGYYNNQGEYIQKQVKAIKWCCPKCRSDYLPSEVSVCLDAIYLAFGRACCSQFQHYFFSTHAHRSHSITRAFVKRN